MLDVKSSDTGLAERLRQHRERLGLTQEDVATLTGQPRPVVADWEREARRPNAHQMEKLAAVFRVPLEKLLSGEAEPRPEFEQLLYRDAGDRLDGHARYEIQRFLAFLDAYGDFLEALGEPPGMTTSPFSVREGQFSKDDVRQKAEDARAFLRLGSGPIAGLAGLADLAGLTVYLAPLGADLAGTVSGAFVPHHRVGFSVVLNSETTPGRRHFTLAHEIAHALFHGDRPYIEYQGRREVAERFANAFAGEFLVPTLSLRATVESFGVTKVTDPETVVHLQRHYRVSYETMLVRLRQVNLATAADAARFREVRPVHLASRLGYAVEPEEWAQEPEGWGLGGFPPRFLRLLRRAVGEGRVTVGGVASMTGVSVVEIDEFLADRPPQPEEEGEFVYLQDTA